MFTDLDKNKEMLLGSYKKLKSYYHYNKNFVFMKKKIAELEADEKHMLKVLENLAQLLADPDAEVNTQQIDDWLGKIDFYVMPKSFTSNSVKNELFISAESNEEKEVNWSYFAPFDGFKKLLTEMNVNEYQLMIDREGKKSHTLNSAMDVGLENVTEEDSKDYVGIRMADLLVGLISRLMQSLKISLTGNYKEGEIKKTLLDSGWFALNQRQLDLYKKLYRVICENNDYWYKSYSGIYSDDLVAFVALLQFVNHFSDADEIRNSKIEMQLEYYNAFVCESLNERYKIMRNKLPIDPIVEDGKDYFYNQRGAKVYKDINKQPMLPLHSGQNEFYVLSVGFSQNRTPLVTISENDKPICYRLPNEYSDWTMTVAGVSSMGERLFPSKVLFSLIGGRYLVDIL